MLLSKPLSRPEIKVPIKVTVKIPIMMLSPVRKDRILFDKIELIAIRILSKYNDSITKPWSYSY